jgi:MarR-like DNA-binding transcriptional regulator SgrR of sgrS sRNA
VELPAQEEDVHPGWPASAVAVVAPFGRGRAGNPQLAGDRADFFPTVKSITATGPYTVVVTLTHPDPSWQDVPATVGWPIFEKSFAEAHKGTLGNPGVLVEGTGPWEFDSLDPTKGAYALNIKAA